VRRRRVFSLVAVSSLVLSIGLSAAPVLAGPPTEISVSPTTAYLNTYCPYHLASERAYWTVSVWGGTSGNFQVSVNYGDGTGNTSYHAASYDTHHDFDCGWSWVYQSWSASRSGGGTGHDQTSVYTW
jgi:hypothetical protein